MILLPSSARFSFSCRRAWPLAATLLLAPGCTVVGPEYAEPASETPPTWRNAESSKFDSTTPPTDEWWRSFNDPVLEELIDRAERNNNNLRTAGLRVLESQALLGIAVGSQYPQAQAAAGDITFARSGGTDSEQYNLNAFAAWEIDFWGKFQRGIESADAALLASIASFDDLRVILNAAVASTYVAVRTTEEQLRIARENIVIQQRSYDIVEVLYRNGDSSELDMQQALTLLRSTEASIPQLETVLAQAKNALSVLLGELPGKTDSLLSRASGMPEIEETIAVGIPANTLRMRPDVRQAELLARAQNAQVGVAQASLYPSFSIAGSLGVSAAGAAGDTDLGDLFDSDAITYGIGPSFTWPFLNYDRLQNNIRVQDARLQQLLFQYRETVIEAVREVEDALVGFEGARQQEIILTDALLAAKRSADLALLRYREGFSDYQRVLDAQKSLFNQQERYVINRSNEVLSLINLHKALGGGWQDRSIEFVDDATKAEMEARTNWDEMIDANRELQARDPYLVQTADS